MCIIMVAFYHILYTYRAHQNRPDQNGLNKVGHGELVQLYLNKLMAGIDGVEGTDIAHCVLLAVGGLIAVLGLQSLGLQVASLGKMRRGRSQVAGQALTT